MSAFSPSPPSDLTIPDQGSMTLRAVFSMSLRKLFEDLKGLRAPAQASEDAKVDHLALRKVLVGFLPGKPGAIASLLRRPVISAPLRCLRDGHGAPDPVIAEFVGQSLFELSLAGVLDEPVTMRAAPPMLSAPHRQLVLDPAGAQVTFGPRGVELDGTLATPTRGTHHHIADDIVLCTYDNNPLALFEAHPDKAGNAVDLGNQPASAWVASLRASLDLIEATLPEFRRELALILQQVVPVGVHEQRHLSASYREVLGTIYMTLHPRLMTMTEALVHEVSHNKLNAMFELDPLLHNGFHPLFRSPVRPDPRPLHGILLAVHAFQPVARLYEKLLEQGMEPAPRRELERRFAEIRTLNREGAQVLIEHAEVTDVGRGLMDEIVRWDRHFS